jgi:lipopolysaccharide core heptose(I) kinase
MIYVRDDLKPLFTAEKSVADFLNIDGEVFKQFPHRRTLKFERGGQQFFIKSHWNFGWREIIRKLLSLHVPVVSAKTEWRAIQALERIGLDTMKIAAYGEQGVNPAAKRSFIVTHALAGTESLEKWAPKFMRGENSPEKMRVKHAMIRKVAQIARRLHTCGLNHRDLYLCHFLLDIAADPMPAPQGIRLYLIDLHRMQIRSHTPQRWMVKDIAGVLFSSMDLRLTSRDFFRFMKVYRGKALRVTLAQDRQFWNRVLARANDLYRKQHALEPKLPRGISPLP